MQAYQDVINRICFCVCNRGGKGGEIMLTIQISNPMFSSPIMFYLAKNQCQEQDFRKT